jgi:hypothetical protein
MNAQMVHDLIHNLPYTAGWLTGPPSLAWIIVTLIKHR